MPSILDSREEIKKLDTSNVLGSVESLPDQIADAWTKASELTFPDTYPLAKNVVVAGMGGSALGSWVIKRLFKDELTLPFEVYSHYALPGYVDKDSLVLLSSYSGSTEETLAAGEQAARVGAKVAVIASGGELEQMALKHGWPAYIIDPVHNPSGQPRMAIGYAIAGQLAMFTKMGLINVAQDDIDTLVDRLRAMVKHLTPGAVENNAAKYLAYQAYDKQITLTAAEHLVGAAHVTNNQLNENAKVLTAEWHLPEFNHHYLEALKNPSKLKEDIIFFLYNSYLYNPRVTRRVELTKTAIEKSGFQAEVIQATASTPLEQVFEIITLGAFFNFYLAMLYKLDPAPIPTVDWFKSEMAK